jgi:predicted phosphodiesterase
MIPIIRNVVLLFVSIIHFNLIFGQKFAVVSDIHGSFPATLSVSNLVKSWHPEFIITCGDNNYASANAIDAQIGQFYHEFIYPYTGSYGLGDSVNSFYSALGNHDVEDGGISSYLSYVNLPGNERYYDFVKGFVHFFCINSNADEPDGVADTSVQAQWLQNHLAASTSLYNLVYFHHSPYTSGMAHGSITYMQWPFKKWGATAVFSGHDHIYERLNVGNFPYFVCGTGGGALNAVSLVPGSQFIDNLHHGALLLEATAENLLVKFINTNDSLIDSYFIAPVISLNINKSESFDDPDVTIYPNPAGNHVSIRFKNNRQPYSITITDIFGRIVFFKHYINNSCNFETTIHEIDVEDLTKGIYFAKLSCQDKEYSGKIVIN